MTSIETIFFAKCRWSPVGSRNRNSSNRCFVSAACLRRKPMCHTNLVRFLAAGSWRLSQSTPAGIDYLMVIDASVDVTGSGFSPEDDAFFTITGTVDHVPRSQSTFPRIKFEDDNR